MVIERGKDYKIFFFVYMFFSALLIPNIVSLLAISIGLSLLIFVPIYLIIILDLISTGRTFIMDEEGCTVCFWKYRKKYTWGELKTKRIEKHVLPSMFRGRISCPYLKEAIFAPYKIRKPKVIRAAFYSIFHPLSCIYVNFALENSNWQTGRYYEVEEATFRQKMQQWGVDFVEGNKS